MNLPVPAAGSTTLALVVPGEHTSVNISPGLITNRTSENGYTTSRGDAGAWATCHCLVGNAGNGHAGCGP